MKLEKFEDIIVWQKGKILAKQTYSIFSGVKDYGFKDQILRAVVSITNNIAEGFERKSNKEFKQFLFIAKGSCGEVRSMLSLAKDLNYIKDSEYESAYEYSQEISRMLSGLIKTL